jgi:2-oxoglutarate dehydrogenase E2 component (dihydrolipoamide succinyltransferase)
MSGADMSSGGVDIMLERETANDESALVVAVHVQSGCVVAKDDVLFDIENSKATQEVVAPVGGVLSHGLMVGQTVAFGVPIAWIGAPERPAAAAVAADVRTPEAISPEAVLLEAVTSGEDAGGVSRFSRAALGLLDEFGLAQARFSGGFVTSRDVRALAGRGQGTAAPMPGLPVPGLPTPALPAPALPAPAEVEGVAVASRKRAEIDALSRGAGNGMLSVLGVDVGAIDVARHSEDFLSGRITDLVIYEASRLMRKYQRLNGYYEDGRIVAREDIHAGLAIDDGGRLVVYGIEHADRLGMAELSNMIADAVARYLGDQLTAIELSRATFTVTDLSGDPLDFVWPLLPRRQSCIIGITHSARAGFRLFAGFDHRVTEGREVAKFLGELRERLVSFATAKPADAAALRCSFCDRPAIEEVTRHRGKGLLRMVDRSGRDTLCCASCWNGW